MEINTHTHYSFTDEVKKRVKIVDFRSMITTRAKCSYAKKSAQVRTWVVVPQRQSANGFLIIHHTNILLSWKFRRRQF